MIAKELTREIKKNEKERLSERTTDDPKTHEPTLKGSGKATEEPTFNGS